MAVSGDGEEDFGCVEAVIEGRGAHELMRLLAFIFHLFLLW